MPPRVRSAANGNQKGTFVGIPAAIHIHIVKANTHITAGNKKHKFDPDDDASTAAALVWLQASGSNGKPGYTDCVNWLGQPNKQRV